MTTTGETQDDGLAARVAGIETALNRLIEQFDAFRARAVTEREGLSTHLHYQSVDWNDFRQTFKSFVLEVEDRQRDVIELVYRRTDISNPHLKVLTDHPVAADTVDHLHPRGAARDNTRQPRFVAACEGLFGRPLRHLDLGCAGGGLVWDFTQRGHLSIGIEGSDWCRRTQRAEWRTIPERLFTADIRYPLRIEDTAGALQRFDVVTAWEVFEHIPEWAIPALLKNVRDHLADDGLLVASVATFQDTDEAGRQYHATVQTKPWWIEALRVAGLAEVESPFEHGDYPRGSGNPRASDWNAQIDPGVGFHLVARHARSYRGCGGLEVSADLDEKMPDAPVLESAESGNTYPDDERIRDDIIRTSKLFSSVPLKRSILMTSIPKSGTHMLRNILYYLFHENFLSFDFVFSHNLSRFTDLVAPRVLVGHLPFCPESCRFSHLVEKQILLIRNPVDVLVAQARAAFDPRADRADYVVVRQDFSLLEYMNCLVTGYTIEGVSVAPFWQSLSQFSVTWSTMENLMMIDYDQLLAPTTDVFVRLLHYLEVEVPADLGSRITAGRNPVSSRSYLHPLSSADKQEAREIATRLLKFHAPGAFDWYASAQERIWGCAVARLPQQIAEGAA